MGLGPDWIKWLPDQICWWRRVPRDHTLSCVGLIRPSGSTRGWRTGLCRVDSDHRLYIWHSCIKECDLKHCATSPKPGYVALRHLDQPENHNMKWWQQCFQPPTSGEGMTIALAWALLPRWLKGASSLSLGGTCFLNIPRRCSSTMENVTMSSTQVNLKLIM